MAADRVQPQPVPLSADVGMVILPDGAKAVLLQLHSATGTAVYFLPPDFATTVSGMLADMAQQATSGLIVPQAGLPPLNGQGASMA